MLDKLTPKKSADPDRLIRLDDEMQRQSVVLIRVTLAAAIRFIADLEQKEEAAFRGRRSSTSGGSLCPVAVSYRPVILSADEWANESIKEVVEKGKENVQETRDALRKTQAVQRGRRRPIWVGATSFVVRWEMDLAL